MGTVFSSRFGARGQAGRRSGLLRFLWPHLEALLLKSALKSLWECVPLLLVGTRSRPRFVGIGCVCMSRSVAHLVLPSSFHVV